MKNMHEGFEKELISRLLQYREEPDNALWTQIVRAVQVDGKEPMWISWSKYASGIIIAVSAVFLNSINGKFEEKGTANVSLVPAENVAYSLPPSTLAEASTVSIQLPSIEKTSASKGDGSTNQGGLSEHDGSTSWKASANQEELIASSNTTRQTETGPLYNKPSQVHADEQRLAKEVKLVSISSVDLLDTIVMVDHQDRVTKIGDRKKVRRGNQFSAYFMAMPALNYQLIEVNQTDKILIDKVDIGSPFDVRQMGFRLELGLQFPVSKRFSAFAGLVYFQRNQTVRYTEKVIQRMQQVSSPGGGTTLVPVFNYNLKSFSEDAKNLGIQLGMLFKLSSEKPRALSSAEALSSTTMKPKKKLVHFVGLGVDIQKSLTNSGSASNTSEILSSPSLYAFGNLYYRLQYPNVGRMKVFAQPMFNYAFYLDVDQSAAFVLKPYGIGLNIGCTYTLR